LTCNIVCVYDQFMNLEEKLYTSTEVADILGVSLRSVYRYMEEDKLKADVKTATGRHRLKNKNILDFLYPDRTIDKSQQTQQAQQDQQLPQQKPIAKVKIIPEEPVYPSEPIRQKTVEEPQQPVVENIPEPIKETPREDQESPVDWLAKFREAASKFKTTETSEAPDTSAPVSTPVEPAPQVRAEPLSMTSSISDLSGEKIKEEHTELYYYRSMLGGLKEIAQNIDKNARRAYVDYAFTMNAGMSLHKPIKPFSVLHFYVRPQDKEFFERILNLMPADPREAQLCLITDKSGSALQTKKEMHGLFVVSEKQLKTDLLEYGETELASELDTMVSNY